jgi:hypothetical protein
MKATPDTVEQWLPVVGFEGRYEVSDLGRVRSIPRTIVCRDGRRLPCPGQIMTVNRIDTYPMVNLSRDGKQVRARLHILVAEAFLGPKPDGHYIEVCHNNNDVDDPRAVNLRWDTRRNNAFQRVDDGRHFMREATHCPNDHEYSAENTRWRISGRTGRPHRECVACKRANGRKTAAKRRAADRTQRR